MQRVFLGAGLIGAAMATRALQLGDAVTVWNRSPEKAQALAPLGATVAATPAEAVAGQPLIHLALTSDDAVTQVLSAILPHLAPGAAVVDHSTTSPEGAAARARWAAEGGATYLHAPVMMSPEACLKGAGEMFLCGPEGAAEALRPALEPMTGLVRYLGAEPHLAAAYKLIGNAMGLTLLGGITDIFTLGRAQGLAPEAILDFFQGYDAARILQVRGRRMAEGDFSPLWTLKMARKDLGLMVDAAGEGAALSILPGLGARMDALIEEGAGEEDVAVLARDAIPPDPAAAS